MRQASQIASFNRAEAAFGSDAARILVITATPDAPASITWGAFSGVIPPMPISGNRELPDIRRIRSGPAGTSPGWEREANIAPTTRKSAPSASARIADVSEWTDRPIRIPLPTVFRAALTGSASSPNWIP